MLCIYWVIVTLKSTIKKEQKMPLVFVAEMPFNEEVGSAIITHLGLSLRLS